jgi:hypothetical protein
MRIPLLAATVATALAACSPDTPAAPTPADETASPLRGAPEFAGCDWTTVRGARLEMQGFNCGEDHGNLRIEADDALPGFVLVWQGPDGPVRTTAVRAFAKAPNAALSDILPVVREQSPGPYTGRCVFAPSTAIDDEGRSRFVLEPTGEDKRRWEASVMSDEPMEKPCGDLGVGIAGHRYFEVVRGAPTTAVFVEMGSEIQNFDPATLRPVG